MISPTLVKACTVVSIIVSCFAGSARGSNPTATEPLTLLWDPSEDPNVVGYRLYEGTSSHFYTHIDDTGGATAITLSSLDKGVTYYLAVTSYDANGHESPLSGEIRYIMPTSAPRGPTLQAQLVMGAGSGLILAGTGVAGSIYQVQASQDFSSWSVVGTVTVGANGAYQFIDPAITLSPRKYYRLQLTSTGL